MRYATEASPSPSSYS